jgi:esterase/lipase
MNKTHIYCVPGLAANSKIFENLKFTKDSYEVHYIEWLVPESIDETIEHYAQRMCETITEKNAILLGVSFGGIMVQEMSKIIHPKKVFIISSVKNSKELPRRLKVAKATKAYKIFPTKMLTNLEKYVQFFFGSMAKKRLELYEVYMSMRDEIYLKWAIYNVLHWKQENNLENVIHIHGTDDGVFPVKHIKDYIKIDGGTHVMIINKARNIVAIIEEQLNK